jgi:hypothetical protein
MSISRPLCMSSTPLGLLSSRPAPEPSHLTSRKRSLVLARARARIAQKLGPTRAGLCNETNNLHEKDFMGHDLEYLKSSFLNW